MTTPDLTTLAQATANKLISEVSGHAYQEGCDGCDARYKDAVPIIEAALQTERERMVSILRSKIFVPIERQHFKPEHAFANKVLEVVEDALAPRPPREPER